MNCTALFRIGFICQKHTVVHCQTKNLLQSVMQTWDKHCIWYGKKRTLKGTTMTNTAVGSCTIRQKLFQEVAISDRFFLISNMESCASQRPLISTSFHMSPICIIREFVSNIIQRKMTTFSQCIRMLCTNSMHAFEYI